MTKPRIYLDNNASTALRPEVLEAMLPYLGAAFGNSASVHAEGRAANLGLNRARQTVANIMNVDPEEVWFTSGGTEALNQIVTGIAKLRCETSNRLLVSAIEHHAVLAAADALEGMPTVHLPVTPDGILDLSAAEKELTGGAALCALMLVNNETGAVQPVADGAALAATAHVPVICDMVQAAGKRSINVPDYGVQAAAISAHKFGGPKGTGAVVVRRGTRCGKLVHGGTHEMQRRAGTVNVAGAVGLAVALEQAEAARMETENRLLSFRTKIEDALEAFAPDAIINAKGRERVSGTLSISMPGLSGEAFVMNLDMEGIAASTGAACEEGAARASHVLAAMGVSEEHNLGTVRLSLSGDTTKDEIDRTVDIFKTIHTRMRELV